MKLKNFALGKEGGNKDWTNLTNPLSWTKIKNKWAKYMKL